MSDEEPGAGAHTEATRDPGRVGTEALGKDRLAALYRISRELLSERAPVAVVERILSAATSALAPERACLLALAADGGLRPLASPTTSSSAPNPTAGRSAFRSSAT